MSGATATLGEKTTATIVDVLRLRAETQKDQIAYRFLADGEEERGTLTYGELYRRARQVAGELQRKSAVGQRALLLDSSESDYIVTFFGCLCAGVIAVPIYAPRVNKKGNARVKSVVADAQPSVVLTTGAGSPAVRDGVAASAGEQVKWIDTNALPVDGDELWTPPAISGTDIAFLQYTSGSTAAPKGVMVSHANILHNERMIQNAFDTKPSSVIVGWLPLYHDMGLIGNVLQPLFAGVPCILMSPVAFLQRPLRWLQAISRYQATTSGGPNFAYELCMRKIRPEDRSGLDLSSWQVAFNGAEPVRLDTVNRFAAQFADCGFRREAFVPCYGLAEATLFVSGSLDPNGVTTVNHGANGNSNNRGSGNGAKISRKQGKLLVACGRPPEGQTVRIVSPDSLRQCSAGDVGEIWVSGPSVARGYWRKAKETEETFNARIPEIDEGLFLRTGDLGFLKDGHLFITGRLKDLLIIRGQNYYPQDIELTVEQSHPILQPGSGAAFSVEVEGEERLVVVQEIVVRKDPESIVQSDLDELDALIKLISRNIVAGHELQAFAIVLIRKGTIPKTSSGKIQRHACRDAFLNRELYVLREWHERKQTEPVLPKPSNAELDGHVPYGLASWVAQEIARIQGIDQERVDLNQPFAAYGFDSLAAIEFAHKLQTEFQVEVEVSEFFSDSTITEIIQRATDTIGKRVSKRETEQPARYPLSYGQRALWFVHQTAPESAAYNIARVIRIASGLDVGALRLAFQALVDRHPCLRTIVVETAGEPIQQVAEKVEVSFEYFDACDWSQVELEKALVQQNQRPFSLTLGPLFRTALYARSEKEYLLHVAVHHLVADYWSLTLLLDEIGKLYQASAHKVDTHLVPLEYSYADFVEWQREKLSGPAGERLRDYWKNELAGELPPLSLPADHIRPPVQTFRGASFPFNLDARLTEALKRLGEEQQATLFTTLLAAFQVLLYRLTSQKQVIVGCPIAGRSRAEFANTVGYFVNAAPLRADFQQRQTFTEFLSQVRNRVSKAFAHELYPFSLMVEQLGIARDPAVPPIFQSAFAFQQTYGSRSEDFVRFALGQPQAQVTLGGLQLEHVAVEQRTAQFDLTLSVGEGPDGIVGAWEYSSDLFEKATIARWAEGFSILLEEIISHPDISVSQLPILSDSQYDQLVEELNRTKLEYDSDRCLHELIEEQAKTKPASAAIVFRETELSYKELNERANQVARYLLRSGVRKEDLVGVCMRRSPEMVVAMLGIWKANAAYVPLDPQYPEERLRFMLEDADAKAVITEESLKERVGGTSATVLSWDGAREQIDKESSEKVGWPVCSLQLAYLIYTSGSSGVPKGVMLTHRNAVSFVAWAKQAFTEEEFSGVLAATSICFDLSIFELWATLSCGGTVVLADDVISWWESLQGGRVTNRARLLNTVPSAAAQLIEQGPLPVGVVTINLAGEALKEELVSELWQWGTLKRVNNLYGPTETTTYSSWITVEAGKKVTVGRGVGNTRLYVLDQELGLAPFGVVGELYIAGAGVGRGYWGQASLTADRFLPDPYSKTAGHRMYRTGDLVRWNNAGQLEYLGRADQQVKVRGYRIELGEIEASMSRYPAVRENVVVVRESGRDRLLVAYAAPKAGMEIKEEQLREYLRERLPRYMLPSTFMILESLPKTPNGKVDRKALPEPRQGEVKGRKPQSETEEMVAAIWAQVMQLDQVGMEENFFGLGGHSLLAMQVMSRIRQVFAVELQLRSFLENPTVAALALLVDKAAKTAIPPLLPLPRRQNLRLSFAQERLWFLSRYEGEAGLYNVPVAVRLRGELNIEAAKASLQEMVNRHEVLRTSFAFLDGEPVQEIGAVEESSFRLLEHDLRGHNDVEAELAVLSELEAGASFDLEAGPLIRGRLIRLAEDEHVLLVTMHHIVSDGWSLGVMLREFSVLYDSFSRGAASPLPPLPIQYADYSEWQREWLQGEVLERQLDYWRKQLAGHEALNLPTDRPHSAKPTLAGAMEMSRLPEPLVSKLKLLSDQQGVTLFMTLLAGFDTLLYRYTGQTDISVGLGIANRNRQELEPLIGFFVNTLVLRTQFTEDSSVAELLQRVREVSLQAYAHQDIPFERLVEALDPVRELSRTPFFQALFVLQNAPLPKVSWNGLEATARIVETGTAKFDLTLSAREEDGELELSLEYRTELFNAERMKRLLQHYRTLLEGIVVSVGARISELEILSKPERQQLLVEWNRTEAPYSTNKCVHQLFEEQAAKTPQAVAVRDEDGQISYGELNRRANQLAHYLAKMGVGPEVRVGICMERGLEMMVGVLGVLKAGGAYVPLDPADPSARRSYMVKDAGAKFVLTNERFTQQMAGCTEHEVDLEEAREEIERQSGESLRLQLDAENLAWVIYTSSSAGWPKGTAITHCSAVSMLQRTLIDAMDQNPSVERLLNLYGLTEDTTYAGVQDDGTGLVTIGRLLSNMHVYVVDAHMKLVPVGIKGELYLGSAGHARGYLNRPELTAEKFVPNPFSQTSGERLYRTGDLVRYQENGNLEFLGRLDSQVKVHGYRIEPGEIEAAVLDYPGVTQAAVITREDEPGNVRLVGYVASSERLDVDRLRGHLQQRVPEYMVPAALLQLDTLPLTPNGKVDRKALIELESKKTMEAGSLTLTPTEELIAGVWSSLLEKSDIRRDDNFFHLGGHSLTVIQMLSRLERVFNREIELRAMFEFPVLKDFSAYVDQLTGPAQLATLRPIVPTSRDGRLPLSFAQQRLWFLAQMEGASEAYHIPFGLHLKGDLNRTALGRALDRILVRHEVLRTSFAFLDGEPVQEIGAVEESSFRLLEHDLRGHNDVEAELAVLSELEAGASFDLEAGPLIRGRLIRLAEDEHVLLVTMHHIVSDGWSMGVLVSELKALYGAFLGGEADPLPELEIQYADYAVWQRQWIEGEILQQQAAYWKTTLAGAPALLELPTDHTRPVQQDFAGGFVKLVLDEQLTGGLKDLSRRHGTTLYMTLLAGWAILLARLSGQQDVVIGSPVANRGRTEIENLIGFFVNTLVLRLDLSGSPSVSELLQQTKAQSLAAQRHQDIPFEQVVELAQPVRSLAHSPLFQVMFAWQNATEARLELPGLEVQPLPSASHRVAKFDLTLSLQEVGERIVGALEYATALYERSTLERYREYFLRLVEAMVADDTQVVACVALLPEGERDQVLYEWNQTKAEFPSGKCVHELFEEQVRRSPEATAVAWEEEELSYGELNARANRLANYLRELGVGPEMRVAICVERGFEMIVSLLAVLKAGGAYVPLDPAYPVERLRFMLEDSDPVALLTQTHLKKIFPELGDALPVLDLADAEAAWHRLPANNPKSFEIGLAPQHLAYVIYTSGSTGVPKGVAIEHRNAVNFISWAQFSFACDVLERTLLSTSLNFDLAVFECFVPLSVGATVRLVLNALDLTRTQVNVTLINTVPSAIHAVVEANGVAQTVRTINLAGEPVKSALAERIFASTHVNTVCNLYGPSETTTYSTWVAMRRGDPFAPHIGRPISNTRVYILDARGEPVPVGVAGELYIGGAGVARGYLKRPELTAERFVADPFVEEPGARMYRTGDLGRWLPDGNIEFLGRNDFQVKIRGFRIELGEIEARLAEHPAVREAVVLAREDTAGEKRLVAYYTASGIGEAEAASVGAERLRAHLSAVVPDYMVPAAYVRMERLPLTPNGKLDRKALPAPEQEAYAVRGYEAPVGEMETKLAEVWAEVLQLEKVGRHDNFFELGGHSLLAVRVVSRLQQVLSVEVAIRDLFAHAELADLARHLQGAAHAELSRIMPAKRSGRLPLSFAQQRLWFLAQMEGASEAYHIPFGLHLKGDLNRTALGRALDRILVRHEVLRTSFAFLDGEPVQEIGAVEESSFRLLEHDLRGHNDVEAELAVLSELEAGASFDLEAGPLIRGRLIRLAEDEHVLLVTMHHIVSDGWSLGVMLREFSVLYDSFSRGAASPLPPLPIQYADYSEWQREWLQGEVLERQLDYWRKQLAGHEALNLPTDRPHSAKPTLAGAMEMSRLPEPLVSKLKLLSDQQGVTLFMTLLAGFDTLLYRYTGQTDISVGLGIANRNRQELEPLIGFFVNTLVLRTQFTEDSSVAELLQRVREVSLQAYAHQDIPFERLVEALDPVRELSRTPFFQALFVLQNAPLPKVSWNGLEATARIVETGTAKFDLTLSAREEDGELELSLEYRTELFNAERMKRLLQHYRTLLEGIVVSVGARISELEILSKPERQQLLVEWNRTEAPYSTNKCVHQLFEEQAAKTPQAVAVRDEDGQISYGELNRRANQLAHYLAKMGVGPEVRVGICMERGLEMMVGVLGVLKAGGAYVPLDPADPSARRSYMVKDAGAKFVLTNERFTQQMAGCTEHEVDLEEAREEIERQSGESLRLQLDAENLAWVIYTSSSAGWPKGTAITHCSAVSMLQRTLIDAMDQNPSVERLLNLYGLTEDTTYAGVQDDGTGLVTIGRLLSNMHVYVVDAHMKLVPVGIKGELYLGSAGHARGYLNRPELTAEKFVPNPFSQTSGERLYRTGDLVRYQENGNLEFLGRLDSQVKVHGYRIEPGEIEAAVLDYPGVTQAAVITREDEPGNVRLVGYVASSERLDVDRLRGHLQQRVPEYMVPAALLQLDTLPLTPNGKVDRKALIELESKKTMEAGSLTLTPTEELIAGVWSSLLEKSDIRRDDNFFHLGGHSLTVIQMLSRLERVFNREIELRAMFEFPVLKDFSAYVDQLTGPAQLATLRPIVPTSRDGRLPLSFAQQRLWFLAQMEGASEAYHIPFGLHLKGDLNRTALGRALDRILVRHEVLRTSFAFLDGEPVQEIGAVEESSFRLLEHDLRGHNDVEAELAVLSELEAGASFDLEAGPLIRGRLIRLAEDEHVLLVTMHHIVSDGWSMGVLVSELKALYGAFLGGEADPLPELEIQYADYAVWQRQWIEGEILQQQAAYWKTTLAGAPALLELPTDHTRPVQQDFAGGFVKLVLDEQLTGGLKDLSRRHGTTLYMTLLAGWAILLARLSGQQDVVIGSPVANRGRTEIENLIGFFVNTLVLRLDLSGSPSVSELLQQTKAQSLAAQRHQDIPFEQVVELAQPVRSLAHSPLFQVMFAWQNATEARLELPGLEVQPLPSASHRVAKFDLTLSLQEVGERIVGALEYATALYERSTLERYREYFLRLVEAMVADDTQVVACVALLPEGERDQVLYEWNQTKAEFPSGKCVHELFEEQVRRSPEATAVAWEEEELSYGELNARANRLANYLRELGVGPETRIGLMVERSIEMVVSLLGVLKAGAAYVPLDSGSARERLKYMLEDSGARLVLTSRSLSPMIREVAGPEVLLMEAEEWHRYSSEDPPVSIEPAQLAYVIYTSGSTGRPKGVGVEHRQLVNYVRAIGERLQIEAGMRLGLVSTYAADLGYTMIFPALCYGGCLDVVDAGRVLDASKLEEHFSRHPADYLKIVPSHLWALLNSSEGSGLLPRRWLILGGEASSWDLIQRVKQRGAGCQVLNHYGPTETTVGVLTYDTTQNDGGPQVGGMVPIGRPLRNGKVYVLDSELNPVGVGVSGEIYIGGAGVARGYLKRAELTAEKFLANPYSVEAGGRMYRTGDLGRFLENGNIEFLGRKDHQVKIRGFRVELGEIEAALVEHPKIRQAVVLAREDEPGDKRLVAYVVADQEAEEGDSGNKKAGLRISELREHMLGKLPEYMVPSAYMKLEKLPLTHNGKIDRKNLPQSDPNTPEQEKEYVGPQDPTQETLCRLWQEVLRRARVGIHDNFFMIGGHSLLAVQVISRIKSAFAIEMPLSVIFVAPTVARMAKEIAALNGHEQPQSSPVLVSIQPQGLRAPFFCVHAVGGQVISYVELSQELGLEQPFYGLQSPPANYFPESGVSIEQLATLYNQEIRSVQPRGPYLLSGWSMGGLVAWEMAQQLIKEGEIISLLALIDTAPPPKYREADDRAEEISMLARFALDMSRLVGMDPQPLAEQFSRAAAQDQWKMVQETLTSYGVLAPKTAHAEMTALMNVFTRNALAMNNYSLHPSDQSVVFFRASETPERISKLWTNWSGGGIQFHLVPGDHFTMLRRPNVGIIAETLQRYISMNSNNESRVVSPELSPRELIEIESQHTP